jgi:hypothetical protein
MQTTTLKYTELLALTVNAVVDSTVDRTNTEAALTRFIESLSPNYRYRAYACGAIADEIIKSMPYGKDERNNIYNAIFSGDDSTLYAILENEKQQMLNVLALSEIADNHPCGIDEH